MTSLALAGALSACGEPTDPLVGDQPAGGVLVAITVTDVVGPTVDLIGPLEQIIVCQVSLRAEASGTGRARWGAATLFFFAGPDRSVPLDSTFVSPNEIIDSWSGHEIAAGESRVSTWSAQANIPFGVGFRYSLTNAVSGDEGTANASFTCGPEIPPTPELPTITALTVQSPPDATEPGDSLLVRYTATSALGLWGTAVRLSGPCDTATVFPEPLPQTVSRSVAIPLPAECRLGEPLTIEVGAVDAALQERTRRAEVPIVLTDVTPPRIQPVFLPPTGPPETPPAVDADFFAGDSILMRIEAEDNHELRWLVWELLPAGTRDSLAVSGPHAAPQTLIPLDGVLVGPIQIRFVARDAANLNSAPVVTEPGALRVHPTVDRPATTAQVTGEIRDVVFDLPRGRLYLLQTLQSRVAFLSLATMSVSRLVDMGGGASDFDLTSGGDSLLVVQPGLDAVGVLDLRNDPPAYGVIPLTLTPGWDHAPWRLRATADGRAFVRLGGNNPLAWRLLEVDLRTRAQSLRDDAGNGGYVAGALLERSYDYQSLYLNAEAGLFQRYDVTADAFGPRGSASFANAPPVVGATGQIAAIGLDLYDASIQFQRRVQSPHNPLVVLPVALSPTDGYLYHGILPWGIMRSRVTDGLLIDRTRTSLSPSLLRISPDGTLLVVVESFPPTTSSRISVIDLR